MEQNNDKMLRIIGIDFGTSSTYMNVKRYSLNNDNIDNFDNIIPVAFEHGEARGNLISVIRENADGTYDFGRVANEATDSSVIHRNFKMDLENPDEAIRSKARDLTKRLFSYLYANYKQQISNMGNSSDEVQTIISYPVKWQESTVNFMLKAASDAGFENVSGMDEATAAISTVVSRNFDELVSAGVFSVSRPGYLLLVDMGAGTTDLALCKYYFENTGESVSADEIKIEVVTNWPVSEDDPTFGGREIDTVLMRFIRQYLEEALPPELRHMAATIASMDNNIKLWKENNVSANLNQNKPVQSCGFIRAYLQPDSKKFPAITRDSFEQLVSELLGDYVYLLRGCLIHAAEIDSEFDRSGLDMVILAGGHSSWYFAKEIIDGRMKGYLDHPALNKVRSSPDRIINLPNPQSTVALGLVFNHLLSTFKINQSVEIDPNWVKVLYDLAPNPEFMTQKNADQRQSPLYSAVLDFTSHYTFPQNADFRQHTSVFDSNQECLTIFAFKSFFLNKQKDICFCCEKSLGSPCGFALTPYGIYYETKLSNGCIDWDRFIDTPISLGGWNHDKIYIGNAPIPSSPSCVNACYMYLTHLQQKLKGM